MYNRMEWNTREENKIKDIEQHSAAHDCSLCHFSIKNIFRMIVQLIVCMPAKSLQLYPTVCDPMDYSSLGSSIHGILQTRIVEWVAMPSSRDLPNSGIKLASLMSPPLTGGFFTNSDTWEACNLKYIYGLKDNNISMFMSSSLFSVSWFSRRVSAWRIFSSKEMQDGFNVSETVLLVELKVIRQTHMFFK